MMKKVFCIALAMAAVLSVQAQRNMDNKRMEKALEKAGVRLEGERGSWMAYYDEHIALVVTDERNNRMRIFTPIIEEKDISAEEMYQMLKANFHSALDAKYSIYEGFVVSVFTHPLQELSEEQLMDALQQVINLANNFGTSYSSTDLIFGGEQEEEEKRINESPTQGKRS